ncbi:hypothetical protein PMI22_00791 [Pseudomonas sp. GM21]|uniref:sterol desaturase family protein n=1 Tax=Pseudomonas sp. GM21 TaxID=1144325 RepID=UPI0002725EC4|nr:hypothetical protein [Pseudomonas sp. GM21]EJM24380.1 hypothetical protein PMI22_00791 [Pseudomonas sp. GM21]
MKLKGIGLSEAVYYAGIKLIGWNLLTHANLRWDDWLRKNSRTAPWLTAIEHIIVTPGMHNTHHGWGGPDGKNYCNFSIMFSFFDWIFGTLHCPQGRPKNYGLPGENAHWAEEVFYPFYRSKSKSLKHQAPELKDAVER